MKKNAIFLLCILCLPTIGQSASDIIFYCETDDNNTISVIEKGEKLELQINNESYISNETSKKIKESYIQDMQRDPSYNMIEFHSDNNRFVVGTSKDIATQVEPNGKLITFFENTNNSPIYSCIFGEDINNFDEWKNESK
ncbi:hypothetical protein [Xenorhabdus ishibashii]|uniref:Uncharacterized protein n=1 Tax=Xenorhabdus ishibashii TaxID=1034471 RepID=A0A2D0KGU6_9GAMM|nr:hypothetical protein [Xenorhabdus ishibashii]PHM62651.1 hypothetical protein Xish_01861 [Xenorhabdus ishibashii]